MNRSKPGLTFTWAVLATLILLCSTATGQIEDPGYFPGYWYRIILDHDGTLIGGDGDGYGAGMWYYYPEGGWYRQWYYNGPYDPDRRGYLYYDTYIKAVDANRLSSVEIRLNWATPEWSALGLGRPPLPSDAPSANEESLYMASEHLFGLQNAFIPGSTEPIKSWIIDSYNPEWVSIDFRGSNVYVYRGAKHECRAKQGACCHRASGDCFLAFEEDCAAPYEWLGSGTSCANCTQENQPMDFGDAPDSYGTYLTSNGPRHIVADGIYLGRKVDTEASAQPSAAADGDDIHGSDDEEGVLFTSLMLPGGSATLEVTASAEGYLNAWIDWNQDGTFEGVDEQVFADELLSEGLNHLAFQVPINALVGATFARFRINSRGLLSYQGPAPDGEVEDYRVSVSRYYQPYSNSGKGGLKWTQPPTEFDAATPFLFQGWDAPSNLHQRKIVADDWLCQDSRPITGFQWWGSFSGWAESVMVAERPLAFHLAIWTDSSDPDPSKAAAFGHPDTLVWEAYCANWSWNVAGRDSDPRGVNSDETCFQFTCLLSQDQWFYQNATPTKDGGSTGTVYWLSIAAVYDLQSTPPQHPWGWTTRPYNSGSGAVVIEGTTPAWPPGSGSRWLNGTQIADTQNVAWDVAFEVLTNQGSGAGDLALAPVYRFWSDQLSGHFYTISEEERDALVKLHSDVWTYEGVAFYAYPPGREPVGAKPVYRFWSDRFGHHFYSISEGEKDNLLNNASDVWSFEGIAWYAFE